MSEIGGFGVLTKIPEALLGAGAVVPLAVAMRSYANFTQYLLSDSAPNETSCEIRELG